jgi:hypothetical protein
VNAPDFSQGINELADFINFQVGAWHDFGYAVPPMPECKPIPPLGERSANAIKAGHEAIEAIDQLTRQLYALREQLVGELRQDSDIRAVRIDTMLARRQQEPQLEPLAVPGPEPVLWQCAYCETEFDALRSDGPVVCPACGQLHGPGAPDAQPVPIPWALADDRTHWRTRLADGRTAVIRRVLGDDGESSLLFVPTLYESAHDFVTGPECNGVLAAVRWVAEHDDAAEPAPTRVLSEAEADCAGSIVYLACGDQLDGDWQVGAVAASELSTGTPVACPRHGTTVILTVNEYMDRAMAKGGFEPVSVTS